MGGDTGAIKHGEAGGQPIPSAGGSIGLAGPYLAEVHLAEVQNPFRDVIEPGSQNDSGSRDPKRRNGERKESGAKGGCTVPDTPVQQAVETHGKGPVRLAERGRHQ